MIKTITIQELTIGTFESGILIKRLSGFDAPILEYSTSGKGAFDGVILGDTFYRERAFSIEGEIWGDSVADLNTKQANFLNALPFKEQKKIVFELKNGEKVFSNAKVQTNNIISYTGGEAIKSNFRISFISDYPFLLGNLMQSEDFFVTDSGGFSIPFPVPFSIGNGFIENKIITNDGNFQAFPIIRLYGHLENPTVINITQGKQILITTTIKSGSYLEIDTFNRDVILKPGNQNYRNFFSGDFWELGIGGNEVKLFDTSEEKLGYCIISWYNHFIGV